MRLAVDGTRSSGGYLGVSVVGWSRGLLVAWNDMMFFEEDS